MDSWLRHQMETSSVSLAHLCGEFTGHRWIPLTKVSDAELWYLLLSAPWINGLVNNLTAGDLRRQCSLWLMCLFSLLFRYENHTAACHMNHHGSVTSMETEGTLELFQHSLERNVRYDTHVASSVTDLQTFIKKLPYLCVTLAYPL